jgi:hypothetical protein
VLDLGASEDALRFPSTYAPQTKFETLYAVAGNMNFLVSKRRRSIQEFL